MVKETGATAQNRVGAVVERLKGGNDAAPTDPDKGGSEQLGWQLGSRIVPRQRRSWNMQILEKILVIESTRVDNDNLFASFFEKN
jgi:hypothetical protein